MFQVMLPPCRIQLSPEILHWTRLCTERSIKVCFT